MRKGTVLWRGAVVVGIAAGTLMRVSQPHMDKAVSASDMLASSVSIRTVSHVTIDKFGDSVWRSGTGSGVIVSTDNCEVWTNHHVIEGAAVVEVFPRGSDDPAGIPARVVNSTPRSDFAVLEMDHCDGLADARLGTSEPVQPGDEVFAVGNPFGQNPDSITRGIISHTERYANGATPYLQTDAAINRGNSGGALFNWKGEVIGLNTAIAAGGKGANAGVGYATPIDLLRTVAAQLRDGPPSWGHAGLDGQMAALSKEEAAIFGVPAGYGAVSIASTPESGPSAGKLLARDVVYRIGETAVSTPSQAKRAISANAANESVTFHLLREGDMHKVDITLAEGWSADPAPSADEYAGHLGLALEMWEGREGELGQFQAPVITRIHSLGPAHRAHIASSQSSVAMMGPMVVPFQLDVKTITGMVVDGKYHPVDDVPTVEQIARRAYDAGKPVLLEIEVWTREQPRRADAELKRLSTAFYKIVPAPSDTAHEDLGEGMRQAATGATFWPGA